MSQHAITIANVGLVTSVGQDAASTCAALRAKISNPTETRFKVGEAWLMAHQVGLETPFHGLRKLAVMAAMAVEEALVGVPRSSWSQLPLLLCVAENHRPGRLQGLDEQLLLMIQSELGVSFAARSMVISQGRVSGAVGVAQARALIQHGAADRVLVVAADSLLRADTLAHFNQSGRLLAAINSNGFLPGEGAGAALVARSAHGEAELVCAGLGFGIEKASILNDEPLRADGLTQAIKAALAESGCQMHDLDYRVADLSGEHYYFKEAALALSRTMHKVKDEFDIWHPAECIGETGSVVGLAILAQILVACRKGYSKGANALAHMSADAGPRAAMVLRFKG
jgi:3-oxoacyl-[acyl-carrier-protein] synthase I